MGDDDCPDKLLEAACHGDVQGLLSLINYGVDLNFQNKMNGWTALHWAAKRNHEKIVEILTNKGASLQLTNHKGQKPRHLTTNPQIRALLGGKGEEEEEDNDDHGEELRIEPHYLKRPVMDYKTDLGNIPRMESPKYHIRDEEIRVQESKEDDVVVLKVRISDDPDPDFIEIDLPKKESTMGGLVNLIVQELGIKEEDRSKILKIRKLPNTKLRRDLDIKRLTDYTSLEIVIRK